MDLWTELTEGEANHEVASENFAYSSIDRRHIDPDSARFHVPDRRHISYRDRCAGTDGPKVERGWPAWWEGTSRFPVVGRVSLPGVSCPYHGIGSQRQTAA
jgi:hypothetical protein